MHIRLALLACLLLTPLCGGCSTLLTVAYLIAPEDVPAEFKGLRGKHVAVVCRPIVELQFSDAGSSRELAGAVGMLLERNVRKVRVISQEEVARWIDENAWDDLYRGRATLRVRVYDVAKGKTVFEKRIDDIAFPADSAVPTSDRSEAQFRGMFLQILAQRISRSFFAHDSRETFAEENLTF